MNRSVSMAACPLALAMVLTMGGLGAPMTDVQGASAPRSEEEQIAFMIDCLSQAVKAMGQFQKTTPSVAAATIAPRVAFTRPISRHGRTVAILDDRADSAVLEQPRLIDLPPPTL